MLPELRFPALSMVILFGMATAVARIFAVRKDRRGLFISMFFNSNTILRGTTNQPSLFGDASIPYVLSITCVIRPFSGPWGPTSFNVMGKERQNLI